MALFTAGYEGVDIDTFLRRLQEAGVEKVLDVRQYPISRKRGFSKTAFSAKLQEAGIAYEHIRELGCPKPIRDQYKQDRDWKRYTKGFRAYIATQPDAVRRVVDESQQLNACLLCFEADATFCHRRLVAEAGKHVAPELPVRHLAVKRALAAAL
ncbi:DUF488 domain-containing protein [Chromohalobacter israelensis]|uniref:DUF488 domain-containing protein n=1 Tax=Chromohalobacter israelensis TaxID=141390 RepID=UPI001CC3D369|nr:DUF488 domain-containing protein [Chromohalobacter salexigens]MBZ5876297.1 DUF488 domain-containing protein [Chromohalobacter salexigens]